MTTQITSDAIRAQLRGIWPALQFVVLSDPMWLVPSADSLAAFVTAAKETLYVERLFECEEHALCLVATQRKAQAKNAVAGTLDADERFNWPLGVVFGTRFDGQDITHWANICITQEGIRLVEPQTGRIWEPDPARDHIDFLFM